jgi:hypothetical protein
LPSLSRPRCVGSSFPWPFKIRSVHRLLFCLAFMMSCQFNARVLCIWSLHLFCYLPRLRCPSVNPNIKSPPPPSESDVSIKDMKYISLPTTATVCRERLVLIECDLETSKRRRPRPDLGCCATGKEMCEKVSVVGRLHNPA